MAYPIRSPRRIPDGPGVLLERRGPGMVEGIDVWALDLDRHLSPSGRPDDVLSDEEKGRASRFHLDRDRDRYRSGRTLLRLLLAGYLGVEPGAVPIIYRARGKPGLGGARDIDFNLAHSEGVAVVAVTDGRPVGVDIERLRSGFAGKGIAEALFTPAEVVALRQLPAAEQEAAFLVCWTRKEAFVKAKGGGLSIPLDAFTVTITAGEAPSLSWSADAASDLSEWQFEDLSEWFPGHAAALVAGR
jgi:4'-phosphopantetheinyl transferase